MNHRFNSHDEGTHEVPNWQKPAPVHTKRATRKQPELLFILGLFGAVAILFAAVTTPF